jgi:hypothetical protein
MANKLLIIKNDLNQVVDLINSFQSETIQVKLFDTLMKEISLNMSLNTNIPVSEKNNKADIIKTNFIKKVSKQHMLDELVDSDYFDTGRSLQDVVAAIKDKFDNDIKTTQLSGMLLKSIKINKLSRFKDKIFLYTKPDTL